MPDPDPSLPLLMEQQSSPPHVRSGLQLQGHIPAYRDRTESNRSPLVIFGDLGLVSGKHGERSANQPPQNRVALVVPGLVEFDRHAIHPRRAIARDGHDAHLLTFGGERQYQEQNECGVLHTPKAT